MKVDAMMHTKNFRRKILMPLYFDQHYATGFHIRLPLDALLWRQAASAIRHEEIRQRTVSFRKPASVILADIAPCRAPYFSPL